MILNWFLPLGILIGAAGTQTAIRVHHGVKGHTRSRGWMLLLAIAWLPSFCWILAQFVDQY